MLGEDDVLPVTITVARLPRSVRYVWAPDDHVLVLASWLDEKGRIEALNEWPPAGTMRARTLRIVPNETDTHSPA